MATGSDRAGKGENPSGFGAAASPIPGAIVYVGAELPKRSETFVYRELFGLRERGWSVLPVSVRQPGHFDEPDLANLAGQATVAYGRRAWLAPLAAVRFPGVFLGALADAMTQSDLSPYQRLKVPVQAAVALQLAWRLQRENVVHVHAHMAHVPTTFALYISRALKVPLSFTGHAADLFVDRQMLEQKIASAAFVACISEWHREFYRSLASSQSRFPIIRCGVDTGQFAPVTREFDGGPLRLVAVGRLVEKKGFDVLIRALELLTANGTEGARISHLDLVGGGPEADRLLAAAERTGVADRMTFHGEQPNDTVRAMLAAGDIFVLPCRRAANGDMDGIPVALMEAMASGIPVISGRLPAIEELVEDGVSGLLVPPDDAIALANAISRLAGDEDLRSRLASAGRTRVAQEFSSAVNLRRLEDALRTSIRERKRQ